MTELQTVTNAFVSVVHSGALATVLAVPLIAISVVQPPLPKPLPSEVNTLVFYSNLFRIRHNI